MLTEKEFWQYYRFAMTVSETTHITFGVKACQDAIVLLTDERNIVQDGRFVEVIIIIIITVMTLIDLDGTLKKNLKTS